MIQIRPKAISAACLLTVCGTAIALPASAATAIPASAATATLAGSGGGSPAVTTVTAGPARSLGEPAAAQDSTGGVMAATSFGGSAARVETWTRTAGSGGWRSAGPVLPSGFGTSYDASAAAAPGGPAVVVAGAAPPGQNCINGGSVAIATVRSSGGLSPARLVSDQRGSGNFDDRPAVAVGPGGTVWAAWSQGPDADACQNVGVGDHLEVAVSHDGGQSFGTPAALPAAGGNSAFGARLAPLPGGRVAVSWTEQFGGGQESVLVSALGPDGRSSPPRRVLTGAAPPTDLPGASFFDFPAGGMAVLPGGSLVVAVPLWRSGRAVIDLAAGTPGGQWKESEVGPPGGSDLLLPALAATSASPSPAAAGPAGAGSGGTVRLLCAVHTRSGDRLGYAWTDLRVPATAPGGAAAGLTPETGLTPVTPAPKGPGFFELGEELSMSQTPDGLLAPVVVAGGSGARLQALAWRQAVLPGGAGGAGSAQNPAQNSARAVPGKPARAVPGNPAPRHSAGAAATLWTAAALVLAAAGGLGARRLRRRARPTTGA